MTTELIKPADHQQPLTKWLTRLYPLFLAILLALAFYLSIRSFGVPLSDEGYLWYGVTQTALGEIPQFDFHSYEPFRYYWSAAWSFVFGDNVAALRISLAILHFVTIWLGILTVRKVSRNYLFLAFSGLIITLWSLPYHKLHSHFIMVLAIYVTSRLVENPTKKRYFASGVVLGFAAIVGRNHALYLVLSYALVLLFIWLKINKEDQLKKLAAFSNGGLLGFSPMLLLIILTPGMWQVYLREYVFVYFEGGKTNLHLPFPTLWSSDYINYQQFFSAENLIKFGTALMFLVVPVFYISAIIWLFLRKKNKFHGQAVLLASLCIGLFCLHHALDRAEPAHLSQAIQPFNIAIISLAMIFYLNKQRIAATAIATFMIITTFLVPVLYHPRAFVMRRPEIYTVVQLPEDALVENRYIELKIKRVSEFVKNNIGADESLLILPSDPGFYRILDRKASIFNFKFRPWGETEASQQRTIAEIEREQTKWILARNFALDNREELMLKNANKLVWEYLVTNYIEVKAEKEVPQYSFWKRK